MTQRRILSTRPLDGDDPKAAVEQLNRETIPFIRQLGGGTSVVGSRGGATVTVLAQLLSVLNAAGIITDKTTP